MVAAGVAGASEQVLARFLRVVGSVLIAFSCLDGFPFRIFCHCLRDVGLLVTSDSVVAGRL